MYVCVFWRFTEQTIKSTVTKFEKNYAFEDEDATSKPVVSNTHFSYWTIKLNCDTFDPL